VTASELESDHTKPLPGEALDPETPVHPVNLAPAEPAS
jgi:hypothetical protein